MNYEKLKEFHNQIYTKYSKQMMITRGKTDSFYCYIMEREVIIPLQYCSNPTEWSVFAFLHEVGHILTNTVKMKRYEQEYYATQWALDEAKKMGFPVPDSYISTYQDYIFQWRDTSLKLNGRDVWPREQLMLKY